VAVNLAEFKGPL